MQNEALRSGPLTDAAGSRTDLRVQIAGVEWKNPVTTASGTFSARESGAFYDISRLGAVTTKGVAAEAWDGNPAPRIAETWGGMLNAVGLQNPGAEVFVREELPYVKSEAERVIVNVAGRTTEEYCAVVRLLTETDADMLEINISCPNIKEGGISFGTDAKMAADLVHALRQLTDKPLIVKLTPNVTDICAIASAVESAGADAVSLINTLLGMRIDLRTGRPVLANRTGGLSGPAVKPVAVRMVWQVAQAVRIPIIGMGGIMTGEDAAEFLMAGATAVAVGTAALVRPTAPVDVLDGLAAFMRENGFLTLDALRSCGHSSGGSRVDDESGTNFGKVKYHRQETAR